MRDLFNVLEETSPGTCDWLLNLLVSVLCCVCVFVCVCLRVRVTRISRAEDNATTVDVLRPPRPFRV